MQNTSLSGRRILCDGYVIERYSRLDNILIFSMFLCDGYVIKRWGKLKWVKQGRRSIGLLFKRVLNVF